ncbi:unnamed protein product [Ectocarpus sp. 12 AP-2014]
MQRLQWWRFAAFSSEGVAGGCTRTSLTFTRSCCKSMSTTQLGVTYRPRTLTKVQPTNQGTSATINQCHSAPIIQAAVYTQMAVPNSVPASIPASAGVGARTIV